MTASVYEPSFSWSGTTTGQMGVASEISSTHVVACDTAIGGRFLIDHTHDASLIDVAGGENREKSFLFKIM